MRAAWFSGVVALLLPISKVEPSLDFIRQPSRETASFKGPVGAASPSDTPPGGEDTVVKGPRRRYFARPVRPPEVHSMKHRRDVAPVSCVPVSCARKQGESRHWVANVPSYYETTWLRTWDYRVDRRSVIT